MTDLAPQELRMLVEVAEAGSFTAAASRLGLTQSAVSHAVSGVETKVGAVLFTCGRRGARPTPAGERAVAHARRILRLLHTLPVEARAAAAAEAQLRAQVAGPVRIAAFRSVASRILPQVLELLRERHPALRPQVSIVRDLGRGTAGEVQDGRADLALATLQSKPPKGLAAVPLFQERYRLVHPAQAPDPTSLPLVDWVENCGSYTREWWGRQDWIPPSSLDVEDEAFALSVIARGLGMSIMPELSSAELPPGVAATELEDAPTRVIGCVTTPELAATAPVRAVVRALRDVCADLEQVPRGA